MNSEFIIYDITIVFLFLMSAFFSGIETAIISANPIRLKSMSGKGHKQAIRASRILANLENAIGMTLIGNNIANIAAAAFVTYVATKAFFVDEKELLMVTAVQTVIFLIACEIIPKVIARAKADSMIMVFSFPVSSLMFLLKPAVKLSLFITGLIKKKMKLEEASTYLLSSRDEIGLLFELSVSEGIINKDHHDYVNEFLSFNQLSAQEVMTPLIDIISIEKKQSIRKLVSLIDKTNFSRIPVYEERVDNIIGYIHYKDLLEKSNIGSLEEIIHKPQFIPSTKIIRSLVKEMQESKDPLVFIVNEYGAVIGLITMEDIAEEVVGEIQTREHPDQLLIQKLSKYRYALSGDLDIDYFQRRFNIKIEKKGFATVAGFMTYYFGRIPRKNERFEYENHIFIVDEATDRSVEKVILFTTGTE